MKQKNLKALNNKNAHKSAIVYQKLNAKLDMRIKQRASKEQR